MEDKLHIASPRRRVRLGGPKISDIKPLMIAVSKYHSLKAHVIVKGDCPCVEFDELKGKDFAVPFRAARICVSTSRKTALCGQCDPKSFFNQ